MISSTARISLKFPLSACGAWFLCLSVCGWANLALAQTLVPGAGHRLENVGDDFEDPQWSYNLNLPKSSQENDEQERFPSGRAANGRWAEGIKRGQPDVIRRVAPPPDGLPGSQGAMLLVSKQTGIPGNFNGQTGQDDLIALVDSRIGGPISVNRSPSVVVRVYLPPWEKWENREGNSFAFRAACEPSNPPPKKKSRGFFSSKPANDEPDTYWPGILIGFDKGDGVKTQDAAILRIRAGNNGGDIEARRITEPGWWTLGMSFTPDGQVHYFAHAGVEDLRAEDHLASQYPYGLRCDVMKTFFFDVLNANNGGWSTPWIVDDVAVYVAGR